MAAQKGEGQPRRAAAGRAARASSPAAVPNHESSQDSPPAALRQSAFWWLRAAAIVIALYYGWLLLGVVRGVLNAIVEVVMLFVFGLVVAMLVQPVVDVLEKRARVGRVAASLLTLGVLVGGVVLCGYLLASPLVAEATGLSRQLPGWLAAGQADYRNLTGALHQRGLDVGQPSAALGTQVAGQAAGLVVGGLQATLRIVVDSVVVLVTAFWLLKDGATLKRNVLQALPLAVRSQVAFAFEAISAVVGGYARAQLLIAVMIGTLAGGGCWALGVPYPIVVGLAAGVFELVPIVGPFAGGAVGITLALTRDPVLALWTLALFVGIHILEGYVLAPRIQAQFTKIPEFVAFLAIFAGIEVAGFVGALFAVPVASLGFIFLRAALGDLRADRPDLFRGRGPLVNDNRRRLVRELNNGWMKRLGERVRRRRAASG